MSEADNLVLYKNLSHWIVWLYWGFGKLVVNAKFSFVSDCPVLILTWYFCYPRGPPPPTRTWLKQSKQSNQKMFETDQYSKSHWFKRSEAWIAFPSLDFQSPCWKIMRATRKFSASFKYSVIVEFASAYEHSAIEQAKQKNKYLMKWTHLCELSLRELPNTMFCLK